MLKFSVTNPGKLYNTLSDRLTTLKNYIHELKTVHNVEFNKMFIAHIVLKNIPATVRKEFRDTCEKIYPSIDEILAKMDDVILKLNADNSDTPTYPTLNQKEFKE